MKRLGSLRFDGVLGPAERDGVARQLSSSGIEVASWTQSRSGERTYASLRLPDGAAVPAAVVAPPPLVLEIVPEDASSLTALRNAFAGPGRAAGVRDVCEARGSLIAELAPDASLRLALDIIDAELVRAPGRSIAPLLPLPDAALAALAAATLGVGDLDATRLIEYYSEPLLAGRSS